MHPRSIVIVAYPGVQPIDVVGPAEVFSGAGQIEPGSYEVRVVAPSTEPIAARGSAYGIVPAGTIANCRGPIDTHIVAGGLGVQ